MSAEGGLFARGLLMLKRKVHSTTGSKPVSMVDLVGGDGGRKPRAELPSKEDTKGERLALAICQALRTKGGCGLEEPFESCHRTIGRRDWKTHPVLTPWAEVTPIDSAYSPIQPGLEQLQGWSKHSSVPGPHHPQCDKFLSYI